MLRLEVFLKIRLTPRDMSQMVKRCLGRGLYQQHLQIASIARASSTASGTLTSRVRLPATGRSSSSARSVKNRRSASRVVHIFLPNLTYSRKMPRRPLRHHRHNVHTAGFFPLTFGRHLVASVSVISSSSVPIRRSSLVAVRCGWCDPFVLLAALSMHASVSNDFYRKNSPKSLARFLRAFCVALAKNTAPNTPDDTPYAEKSTDTLTGGTVAVTKLFTFAATVVGPEPQILSSIRLPGRNEFQTVGGL